MRKNFAPSDIVFQFTERHGKASRSHASLKIYCLYILVKSGKRQKKKLTYFSTKFPNFERSGGKTKKYSDRTFR